MPKTEGLYLESGYLNIDYFDRYDANFIIIIGGRGTGKTYSGFKKCLTQKRKFLYARRTDKVLNTIVNTTLDPMRPVQKDMGFENITCTSLPGTQGYVKGWFYTDEHGKPKGDPISLAIALSTVGNIRSFDAEEYTDYINDEFIKEPQMPRFAEDEAYVYFNSVETIARNREKKGKPPLRCWLFSNSENIANDYFIAWKLVDILDRMKQRGQEVYYDKVRKIVVCWLMYSPISEEKKKDALYIATQGTDFYEMSVGNEFVHDAKSRVRSRNLSGFYPIVSIGELCIYQSRQTAEYYVSLHKNGACRTFGTEPLELRRFRTYGGFLLDAYMHDRIIFESPGAEALFKHFLIRD